jgi:hypothetical protein
VVFNGGGGGGQPVVTQCQCMQLWRNKKGEGGPLI